MFLFFLIFIEKNDRLQVHSGNKSEEVKQRTDVNDSCVNHKEKIAQLECVNLEFTQKYDEAIKRLKLLEVIKIIYYKLI